MNETNGLREPKESHNSFGSTSNYGKQIKIFNDGYKGPKVLTLAQQNKLLAIHPTPKLVDSRLMQMDDDDNTDEQDDDGVAIKKIKKKGRKN
ncbi:MAG: hypothetical protein EZS28_030431 [Streblomastix strix]|uniref:Uncharacterized protein n=1 Tax=Streblomastix strix TaxID=222440 RepID=A0A5J4UVD0_9EUKA|nr:MAG: hypothetical protein EZS28_030431 [Streblomastix strix]